MATENKKAVRNRMNQIKDTPTEKLLELFAKPMTDTDYLAISRTLKARRVAVPETHGEISEDPSACVQRVIQIEELTNVEIGKEKRKPGMGALEWISVAAGMFATIFVWQRSVIVSVLFGLAVALIVYTVSTFGRRFWREMGTKRGTFDVPDKLPKRKRK